MLFSTYSQRSNGSLVNLSGASENATPSSVSSMNPFKSPSCLHSKRPPCVRAARPHVFQHVDVLPAHTGTF